MKGIFISCFGIAVLATMQSIYRAFVLCFQTKTEWSELFFLHSPRRGPRQISQHKGGGPQRMRIQTGQNDVFHVLSIGSATRPEYMQAQARTWASHPSIDSFIAVTEMDDYVSTCDHMTRKDVEDYVDACRQGETIDLYGNERDGVLQWVTLKDTAQSFASAYYGSTESSGLPSDSMTRYTPGWHCAQRRVLQGMNVLQNILYVNRDQNLDALPEYLVVADDDTYFNADAFRRQYSHHDPSVPRAYAGCLFQRNVDDGVSVQWEFPYGGFGTVYSKGAVQNMLRPLNCTKEHILATQFSIDSREYDFLSHACAALEANEIGESVFFQPGMNVIELFSNYSAYNKQFCLHSDWLAGYIGGRYLALKSQEDNPDHTTFHAVETWPNQCGNHSVGLPEQILCDEDATFCHRQTPEDLDTWHARLAVKTVDPTPGVFLAFPSLRASLTSQSVSSDEVKNLKTNLVDIVQKISNRNQEQKSMWLPHRKRAVLPIQPKTPEEGRAWVDQLYKDTDYTSTIARSQLESDALNVSAIWEKPKTWVTHREVLPASIPNETDLALVIHQLKYAKILNATVKPDGTQLKLIFELDGGAKAIFKPKRYWRGLDRHYSEIASWHLSRLLDMRRAPIAIGRKIHPSQELFPVASAELQETFTPERNCFVGVCETGCKKGVDPPICGSTKDGLIEGVMILYLPETYEDRDTQQMVPFELQRQSQLFPLVAYSPIQEFNRKRMLESPDYCNAIVKKQVDSIDPLLLDMVETSIFDWLIQNVDRHSYERVRRQKNLPQDGAILLLDQGKSFGAMQDSTDHDIPDLLLPLTQCCLLRETTYDHLQWIRRWNFTVSEALVNLTSNELAVANRAIPDPATGKVSFRSSKQILFPGDLAALDRRMITLWNAIDTCVEERGKENVIMPAFEYY